MVFRHVVNANGVYYPAGVDVPLDEPKDEVEAETKVSTLSEEEAIPKKKPGRPPKNKE